MISAASVAMSDAVSLFCSTNSQSQLHEHSMTLLTCCRLSMFEAPTQIACCNEATEVCYALYCLVNVLAESACMHAHCELQMVWFAHNNHKALMYGLIEDYVYSIPVDP